MFLHVFVYTGVKLPIDAYNYILYDYDYNLPWTQIWWYSRETVLIMFFLKKKMNALPGKFVVFLACAKKVVRVESVEEWKTKTNLFISCGVHPGDPCF